MLIQQEMKKAENEFVAEVQKLHQAILAAAKDIIDKATYIQDTTNTIKGQGGQKASQIDREYLINTVNNIARKAQETSQYYQDNRRAFHPNNEQDQRKIEPKDRADFLGGMQMQLNMLTDNFKKLSDIEQKLPSQGKSSNFQA